MHALVLDEHDSSFKLTTKSFPDARDGTVVIQVKAVSLNPADTKNLFASGPGKVGGGEYAGVVFELGPGTSGIKIGDRVAGMCSGNYYARDEGAFAEYTVEDPALLWHIPDSMTFEQASTISVGFVASVQALHQRIFPYLSNIGSNSPIIVYSASTNLGMHAIQAIKAFHPERPIIGLADPSHFDVLKSYGADHVFNYRADDVVPNVRKVSGAIRAAFDTWSDSDSTIKVSRMLDQVHGGMIVRALPPSDADFVCVPKNIRLTWIMAYTICGKDFDLGGVRIEPRPTDYEAAVDYFKILPSLLEEGKLRPIPFKVMQGGLGAIPKGLEELKQGRVRGMKLVYRVGM